VTTDFGGRLPDVFLTPGNSSFADFLSAYAPDLLPGRRMLPDGADLGNQVAHATTIVTAIFSAGVVMAGDRRATMGNLIAQRDVEKVHAADEYSVVGVAGSAGLGLEMVKLFQTELEHYEKFEGAILSLDGKANRLGALVRGNLAMAMQGLAAVPLFAGYDDNTGAGRIFSYDVTGGWNEEQHFHGVGSGSLFARGALKKLYRENMSETDCVTATIQSLYDAADEDSATGGPDLARRIYPVVSIVTADGYRRLADSVVGGLVETVVAARMQRPDGPAAALT
jgi:proteasome beta subunit